MNGNGWIRSYWKGHVKANLPRNSGWYAAVPESCDVCVLKVYIEENLFDCYAEGDEMKHDVYDYSHWYKIRSPHDSLPELPE